MTNTFQNITARELAKNAALFLDCARQAKAHGYDVGEVREYVRLARRDWLAALVLDGRVPFVRPLRPSDSCPRCGLLTFACVCED
ncbi:MAG TPA: hypothetical protein VKB52_00350 [Rhodanobacteraceae bacterium]|nr:hypothetical protein [Rhodanobacteraceae bacterium]